MKKTMQEVIRENRDNYRQQEIKRYIAQKRKEKILTAMISLFIIMSTIAILTLLHKETDKDIKNCIKNHSYGQCMANL